MQPSRLKPAFAAVILGARAPMAASALARRGAPHPARHPDAAMLWHLVAIAGVWFGLLALVMVLSAPDAPPARPVEASPVAPPAAEPELPRTRALRHGGSGAALPPAP